MIKLGVRLLALSAALVLFTAAAPIPAFTIWSPRQVNAAFVQPNGTFVAEVAAVNTASTTG